MKLAHYALALAVSLGITCAQPPTSNVITVLSTTSVDVKPESATLSVMVTVDPSVDFDDVLQSLSSLNLNENDLQQVSPYPYVARDASEPSPISYTFAYTVPFAKLRTTITALERLKVSLKTDKNFDFTYYISDYAIADVSDARRKATADLMVQARNKAQDIAKAAGVSVGPIVYISDAILTQGFSYGGGYSSATIPRNYLFSLTVSFAIQ